MHKKSIVRSLRIFIIPLSATIIFSIIIALSLNSFASNKYKEMYIESNLKISKHQASDISHNKEDEVLLLDNLEDIMCSVAKTVIKERQTITSKFLEDLAISFDLAVVSWFDNNSNIISSSNLDVLDVEIEKGSSVDLFNKSGKLFLMKELENLQ